MAFKDFLNHTCDIYHVMENNASPGYSLPGSPAFSYPNLPDIPKQACHFGVKSQNVSIVQLTPQAEMEAKIKLTLPMSTDIRLNDKIIDCRTGLEYTAEYPLAVKNHHLFVYIKKEGAQKAI